MLGQEPRLPVNFLLGRVQEPVAGSMHDWVREHQTRLQVTFNGTRERLQAAANKRKANYDQHVCGVPLIECQLIFLRHCGHKGRHKIQDIWSPVVYQVVRTPKDGGAVYSIAPVGDLSKVTTVHRSLLKSRVLRDSPGGVSAEGVIELKEVSGDEEDEVDLVGVLPAQGQVVLSVESEVSVPSRQLIPHSSGGPSDVVALEKQASEACPEFVPVSLSEEQVEVAVAMPRRTERVTTGHHSNPHHLPRVVGVSLPPST